MNASKSRLAAFVVGLALAPYITQAVIDVLSVDESLSWNRALPTTGVQAASVPAKARGTTLEGGLSAAGLYGFEVSADPSAASDFPMSAMGVVRLDLGAYSTTEVDLSLPINGIPFVIGRTYLPPADGANSAAGIQGHGWHQMAIPEVVVDTESDFAYIVFGADRYLMFSLVTEGQGENTPAPAGVYQGINGTAGALVYVDTGSETPDLWQYVDPAGNTAWFFAIGGGGTAAAKGQLWKTADAAGHGVYFGDGSNPSTALSTGYDSSGRPLTATDYADRTYTFSYTSSDLISDISVSVGSLVVAEVGYDYYGTSDSNGLENDLKSVTVKTLLTDDLCNTSAPAYLERTTHYRYDTSAGGGSAADHRHLVRMVVEPEGFRRYSLDHGTDPTAASDSALRPYCSFEIEYQAANRLAGLVTTPGDSRDVYDPETPTTTAWTATAPGMRTEISYETRNPSHGSSETRPWITRTSTVKQDPTTSSPLAYNVVYFDRAGQELLSVLSEDDPSSSSPTGRLWATETVRSSEGWTQFYRTPEACGTYHHPDDDSPFLGTPPSAGLQHGIDRVSSGVFTGLVKAIWRRLGDSGTKNYLSRVDYLGETSGARGIDVDASTTYEYLIYRPLISLSREWATTTTSSSTAGEDTTYEYQFQDTNGTALGTSLLVVKTTFPPVAPSHNGKSGSASNGGTAYNIATYIDLQGRFSVTRSRSGRILFSDYDNDTGQLVTYIHDAKDDDTTTTIQGGSLGSSLSALYTSVSLSSVGGESFLTDSTVPVTQLLHRVTNYEYDPIGRRISTEVPSTWQMEGDIARSRRKMTRTYLPWNGSVVAFDVPRVGVGGSSCYGPVTVSAMGLNGTVLDEFMLSYKYDAISAWGTSDARYQRVPVISGLPSEWMCWPSEETPPSDLTQYLRETIGTTNSVVSQRQGRMYSSNGSRLLVARQYTETTGDQDNDARLDSALSYDTLGRVIATRRPSGTIHAVSYDGPMSRVATVSKGTDDDPMSGNMVDLSTRVYDEGGVGNGHLTTSTTHLEASLSVVKTFHWDELGRLIAVQNPSSPHTLIKNDNKDRAVAVALFGGTWSSSWLSNDPTTTGTMSGRRALFEQFYDEEDRPYRTRDWRVDQTSGEITTLGPRDADAEPPCTENNTFHGPEGSEVAQTGKQNTQSKRNRACELVGRYVVFSGNGAPQQTPTHEEATSDEVDALSEQVVVRDNQTGDVDFVIATSTGPTAEGQQMAARLNESDIVSRDADGAPTIKLDELEGDSEGQSLNGRLQVVAYWRDELDREYASANLGDTRPVTEGCGSLASIAGSGSELPSPASWPLSATAEVCETMRPDFLPRVSRLYRDEFGRPNIAYGPTDAAKRFSYDDAGRPTRTESGRGFPQTPTSGWPTDKGPYGGIAFQDCNTDELYTTYDQRGRIREITPTETGDGGVEYQYPSDFPAGYPTHTEPPASSDNDNPVVMIIPRGGTSLPLPENRRTTNYRYNRVGYPTHIYEPSKEVDSDGVPVIGTNGQPLPGWMMWKTTLDSSGRRESTGAVFDDTFSTLNGGSIKFRTDWEYDDLGRFRKITKVEIPSSGPENILSEVEWAFDGWRNLSSRDQSLIPDGTLFPDGDGPAIGMAITPYTRPFLRHRGAWSNRLTSIHYPGGLTVAPQYGPVIPGSSTTTDPTDYIGDQIGRVSQLLASTGSTAEATAPSDPMNPGTLPVVLRQGYYGIYYPAWYEMPTTVEETTQLLRRPLVTPMAIIPSTTYDRPGFDPEASLPGTVYIAQSNGLNPFGQYENDQWSSCTYSCTDVPSVADSISTSKAYDMVRAYDVAGRPWLEVERSTKFAPETRSFAYGDTNYTNKLSKADTWPDDTETDACGTPIQTDRGPAIYEISSASTGHALFSCGMAVEPLDTERWKLDNQNNIIDYYRSTQNVELGPTSKFAIGISDATYDEANALTDYSPVIDTVAQPQRVLAYDDAGNMVDNGKPVGDPHAFFYSYDHENRLIAAYRKVLDGEDTVVGTLGLLGL